MKLLLGVYLTYTALLAPWPVPPTPENDMSRFYVVKDEILAWLPAIHAARERLDLGPAKYSDAAIMAFLHRETHPIGDPYSRRAGSPYWSAIQAYDGYLEDALKGLEDKLDVDPTELGVPRRASELHGKVDAPLYVFFGHMEQYAAFHEYQPSRICVIHKAGIGSLKSVLEMLEEHPSWSTRDAVSKLTVHRALGYYDSWQKLFEVYARWVEEKNDKLRLCSAQYMGDFDDWPQIPNNQEGA